MPSPLAVLVATAFLLGAATPAAPPDFPVTYVEVDEVKRLLDRGVGVDLIDVRTPSELEELHIRGARSIPLRALGQRLGEIPRTAPVVFYPVVHGLPPARR